MIYITGDTHGKFNRIKDFCEKMGTTKDDTMIILGDAGVNYYGGHGDKKSKKFLSQLPIKIFCIHGNHENRPQNIPTYVEGEFCGGKILYEEAYPDIMFAIDGEIYNFGGKSYIVIGGAYSVDKHIRLERGYGWWSDEQPSEETKRKVERVLADRNWEIDGVLSHTCPMKYEPKDMFLAGLDQSMVDKSTEEWLDTIEDDLAYGQWVCGHWHTSRNVDNIQFMYEDYDAL